MYFFTKRVLDLVAVTLLAPIWLPLALVISAIVKLTSPGPVLFRQKRFGKNRKLFSILKFRTMYIHAPKDVPTHLLMNPDMFITNVGRFLRKTSLDELPQLLNILKGDMSLVGPRPALYNQHELMRLREPSGANRVPVGITGLAQVYGRDELTERRKAWLDGLYAKRIGLRTDIWILMKTVQAVVFGRGIVEGYRE